MIYLSNFETMTHSPPVKQEVANRYLSRMISVGQCVLSESTSPEEAQLIYEDVKSRVEKYAVSNTIIQSRQLNVLPSDIEHRLTRSNQLPDADLFEDILENPGGAKLSTRMAYYSKTVQAILAKLYDRYDHPPDDIIHVTCSGYLSPSPVQIYASQRGWHHTTITHSYHMGCYGAFPPVRMAAGFLSHSDSLRQPKNQVDIVHTEMLSAHLDITQYTPGHLINMTIFSDGFIKYTAKLAKGDEIPMNSLAILAMADFVIPDSLDDMSWIPGEHQFDMFLSKNVPTKVRDTVREFIESLCHKIDIDLEANKSDIVFAIHPGGPKIIDHIQAILGLRADQTRHSRKVLFEMGNMSSATVPHIWKQIAEDSEIPKHKKIITMAFGPGLTATGIILEKH